MAKRIFEKANADWPRTTLTEDGGVRLIGRYESPDYGWIDKLLFVAVFIGAAYVAIEKNNVMAGIAVVVWFVLIYIFALGWIMMWLFRSRLDITVYPDRIAVGSKNYSREMPIEFRVEQHEGAQAEERAEMRAGQAKARTYRDAVQVVLQYGEKRVVLASLKYHQMERANALVIRLQNVCANVDAAMRMAVASAENQSREAGEFGPAPDIR